MDDKNKPVTNATVHAFLWAGNMGSMVDQKVIKTDAKGQFEAVCLPQGRKYSMSINAPDYGSANHQLSPEETETNRVDVGTLNLKTADLQIAGTVINADDKPVANMQVYVYGNEQPNTSARTDEKGRFSLKVCEGQVRLSASGENAYGSASAAAGDTNVVITLRDRNYQSSSPRESPMRASLKGKPLPDLGALNLAKDAVPAGKPLLLCLFDCEQRSARRCVRLLAEQHDALRQKGLAVAAVQAVAATPESLKTWQNASPVPFPVGRVAEKMNPVKWATEVPSLPWLILVNKEGKVVEEGFAMDELETKLPVVTK